MNRADDELLEQLGAALAVTRAEPTPDEIDAVRALVMGLGGEGVSWYSPARDTRHPVRHMLVAAALVLGLVMAGALVALSSGAPVPSALRAPARALGFPVDSAGLAAARSAAAALRTALAGPDDPRVAAAAVSLETALGRLSAADLGEIEAEARVLLARAAERLGVPVPDVAPVSHDVVETNSPTLGATGGATGLTGPQAPAGASAPGPETGGPAPSSAAQADTEVPTTEAPDAHETEAPETPETEAPEGTGSSIG